MTRAAAQHAMHVRRRRQQYDRFRALVATPGNLTTGVALPAACTLYASTSSVLAATTKLVDAGTRELGAPAGAANAQHCIGFFEPGVTITKHTGAPGTVSLYVQDPAGVRQLIAQG
jgi:hypothetical protein